MLRHLLPSAGRIHGSGAWAFANSTQLSWPLGASPCSTSCTSGRCAGCDSCSSSQERASTCSSSASCSTSSSADSPSTARPSILNGRLAWSHHTSPSFRNMSTAAASGAAAGGGSSGSSGSGVRDAQTLTVASLTAPKPAAPAAAAPAVATAHPSTRAAHKRVGGAAQSHTNSFAGVDEELLASVLMTPLVRGTVRPPSMQDRMVLAGSAAYLDPTSALHSTMRALYVVKQVLRANGDVYVVNGNSLTAPLMREVAHCCTNANVWFHQGRWRAGSLSRPSAAAKALFKKSHQPNQEVFASRGLTLANLHAPPSTTLAAAGAGTGRNGDEPRLGSLDKWRLWHLGRSEKEATDVLRLLMKQESESAKLPLPGTARGDVASRVRLVVTLAPTHDGAAIDEAFAIGIPTIALVNAHSPLDHITYPVYASDAHVRFQHFFLDWFLKVVNLPPAAK